MLHVLLLMEVDDMFMYLKYGGAICTATGGIRRHVYLKYGGVACSATNGSRRHVN